MREGKHGARSPQQAIAIGLSKARRAGVDLPPKPGKAKPKTRRSGAPPARKTSPRRARATLQALEHEGQAAASHGALSRHAKLAATRRGPTQRKAAARKAAQTRRRHAHA